MTDTLESLRSEIDTIDSHIIDLLEKRMGVTDRVAFWKEKHGVSTTQSGREKEMFSRFHKKIKHRVLRDTIVQIYEQIIHASKTSQVLSRAPKLAISRIGFVGLGLIGGSIAKGVSSAYPEIELSVYKHRADADYTNTVCTQVFDDMKKFALYNDLIVIAAPVAATEQIAKQIAQAAAGRKTKLLVIDAASTKRRIAECFESLQTEFAEFLPTHPMAGSEKQGYENSRPDLFIGQPWIITPHAHNSEESVKLIRTLAEALGSQVYTLSPEEHDKTVAACSHVVFMLATYLFTYASRHKLQALSFAGSGFTGATRTASGNVAMHTQIFQENTANILHELENFLTFIKEHPMHEETIQQFFAQAKQDRDDWQLQRTK